MKFPLMLRTEHDAEMQCQKRVETVLKIDINNLKHKCVELDNRNCELARKNEANRVVIEELNSESKNIMSLYNESQECIKKKHNQLEELERKLAEARWCIEEANKKIDSLERNATVHRIMKKQLKDMCVAEKVGEQLIFKEKVNAIKVFNLAGLMG